MEEDADYTWYLGSEVIKEKSFERSFPKSAIPSNSFFSISLAVRKQTDTVCNPEDDGYDSLSRTLKVVDKCDYLISNTFRGVWTENPLDTFEIKFQVGSYDSLNFPNECNQLFIWNIDNGNTICNAHRISNAIISNRYVLFHPVFSISKTCGTPVGEMEIDFDNKTVKMEYSIIVDSDGDGSIIDENYLEPPKIFRGYILD